MECLQHRAPQGSLFVHTSFDRATQVTVLQTITPLTAFGKGKLLSVLRPESHQSTSRSTALGVPRQSTGTCCSTRPSRPQWHKRFGRPTLEPRVRTPLTSSPVFPPGTQVRTSRPQAQYQPPFYPHN